MTSKELLDKYVRACIEIDREEKNYIPMRPLIVSLKEKDNLEKEILKRIDEDGWHTGIPTEEGWYVLELEGHANLYETAEWRLGEFVTFAIYGGIVVPYEDVIRWQKIESHEEKKK